MQVVPTKYFSNNHFHKAKQGRYSFYALWGIMKANPWLLQGCTWRIGDGKSVDIWRDGWILDHPTLEDLVSPISNVNGVEDLLIQDPRGWNVNLVREVFPPHLTQAILRIQLLPDT